MPKLLLDQSNPIFTDFKFLNRNLEKITYF